MVHYRRNRVPGGTYFFTATLRDRASRWLTDHIEELRRAYQRVSRSRPFETVAIVVLPEHLHAVWRLPEGDSDYSGRWRDIKAAFARALARSGYAHRLDGMAEIDLWQRRYWEHTIRDEEDLQRHVDYIHFNPVKHGLVGHVGDWPHSSFHRYVRRGELPLDWGGHLEDRRFDRGAFGE